MLFALLVLILGLEFVIRMARSISERRFFEEKEMTKIGTGYFVAVFVLLTVLPHGYLSLWVAVFSPHLVIAIGLFSLVKRRSAKFRIALVESLSLVSLKMKTGRSFRQALTEVISECDPKMRSKFSEIGSAVVFSQQNMPADASIRSFKKDLFVANFVSELVLVDREPHAAIRRLAVFREKIRIEDDFRRKSGQVLARIRAQSVVMTALYVALGSFMAWKFGWHSYLRLYASSVVCFFMGFTWMWLGGRSHKWKV